MRPRPAPRPADRWALAQDESAVALIEARELTPVAVDPVSPGVFRQVLSDAAYRRLSSAIVTAKSALAGKVVWNVNSTARGGGVAELLQSLVAYARGAGVDARWLAIRGSGEFFKITKRIHNQVQGFEGDGGDLGEAEHDAYARSLAWAGRELAATVRPGDIVILHDPQAAGLVSDAKDAGARVIWRCHVGIDRPNDRAEKAWEFLGRYLGRADAYVFSRAAFAWKNLQQDKISVIAPSIDPFSPKNNLIARTRAASILISAGLMEGYAASTPYYVRKNGETGLVGRRADVVQAAPMVPGMRLVLQVSRWDHLKDPVGVMKGFSEFVPPSTRAHLVLAGPEVSAVADDPEGADVLNQTVRAWAALPEPARARVHIASLPMSDAEENAAIVNALQRWSEVIVQKSLAEGFGLTVAEAMWKGRPVVASRIGGIQDQIEHGASGILLDDPADLAAMGRAVGELLQDRDRGRALGEAGQRRVREHFLNDRHLEQYAELFLRLAA